MYAGINLIFTAVNDNFREIIGSLGAINYRDYEKKL